MWVNYKTTRTTPNAPDFCPMFDKLKKYFAFDNSVDNDELISDDPDIHPTGQTSVTATGQTPDISVTTAEIFTHVLEQFNKALPDFLRHSVDPEKEKHQLYATLSDDIKAHLAALEQSTTERVDKAWRAERDKLQDDLKKLSQTTKDIEAKRAELKTQQLSADRQKRAMTERIRDLENQVMKLEAEREQLDLENKSMINKVKVAQVYEKDCEELRKQLASVQAELDKSSAQSRVVTEGDSSPTQSNDSAHTTGRTGGDSVAQNGEPGLISALREENDKLQKRVDELEKVENEYYDLAEKMELVEKRMTEIDKMTEAKNSKLAGYKEKLSAATNTIEERDKTIDTRKKELERVKEERDKALQQAARRDEDDRMTDIPRDIPLAGLDDDDILNDTDWVVQTNINRNKQTSPRQDRNKTKKQPPSDDGQMSLW